jgi:ECF sigma factor
MRPVDNKRTRWQDRAHFFAVSTQLMRRKLEHERRHKLKREGGVQQFFLEGAAVVLAAAILVALDDIANWRA